jgi:hexokinase
MLMSLLMAGGAVAAIATALIMWQKYQKGLPVQNTRNQALALLYEFQHAAATPLHVLRQIAEHMAIEMSAGLMTEGKSNLLMLPTFVEKLPDG